MLEVGLRSAQGRGGGTEFESLREYSADDEFRRVDWSATARAGKPIVRTYRAERNQTVIVLLDNGRIMAGRVDDVPRVEHAMDATMMLATVATRLGDKCGLMVFDAKVRTVLEPSKSFSQVGRVTESLFDLEPQLVETDYRSAFAEAVVRFRRRAMLVLLTELNEQAAEEYLVPALPLIARSHLIVVGAVRDPEVERWAVAAITDPESAYRRAAAIRTLAGRARLGSVAQLRRHSLSIRSGKAVRRLGRHVPPAEGNRATVMPGVVRGAILLSLVLGSSTAAASPTQTVPATVTWEQFVHVPAVVDVAGPRRDGRLVVAARGRLLLMDTSGHTSEFAPTYSVPGGPEPYIALSPGLTIDGAGLAFEERDDVFHLDLTTLRRGHKDRRRWRLCRTSPTLRA